MLLAADGTSSSRDIVRRLAAWGDAFRGLPVEVLSVSDRRGSQSQVGQTDLALHQGIAEDVADELMELGWHSAAVARPGAPSHAIVQEGASWRADLIVTGSRGIGTLKRLVAGSVSHDVLFHTDASVLVMRGRGLARVRPAPDLAAAFAG
jgi:nucleotide-binding universal stress UspA family protein